MHVADLGDFRRPVVSLTGILGRNTVLRDVI
jgi:hypothetical protein